MVVSFSRFKKSALALPEILKKYAFLLVTLHLVNFFFNQTMIYFQEQRMSSREDSYIPYMLAVAFVGFFVQSGIKVIWTFTVCHNFSKSSVPVGEFIKMHLEKGVIESLRGFLKSVKWGFLFIVPGIVKAIRYQFVNFVVCTNSKYDLGQVDALETSETLTRKHIFGLIFIFAIFGALTLSASSSHLFTNRPLLVGFTELFSLALFTFEMTYMYFLFEDLQSKVKA